MIARARRFNRSVARLALVALTLVTGVALAQVPIPVQEQIRLFNSMSPAQQQALIRELRRFISYCTRARSASQSTSGCQHARRSGGRSSRNVAAANCLAQTWALAEGDPDERDTGSRSPHQRYPGNRPSSLVLFERLDAATLGKLVALYEHKVFVQGVIWDVNSFDQWGVQLGKRLAAELTPAVAGDAMRARAAVSGALAALLARKRGD